MTDIMVSPFENNDIFPSQTVSSDIVTVLLSIVDHLKASLIGTAGINELSS